MLRRACFSLFEGWIRPSFQLTDIKKEDVEQKAYEFYFLNYAGCKAANVGPGDLVTYFNRLING